ncbi:tetratricopeptide repeat protein [Streptomyces fructofermentans]|uniref:tetratricopeptide repeat protein n=1 Tax=Streptomyces fructofermentans TaxID=152141 RepID=UPI00341166C1
MHEDRNGSELEPTELRSHLAEGLARAGLTTFQLAAKAGLTRTTVERAFDPSAPVPSESTVSVLGVALDLSVEDLLAARRRAAEQTGSARQVERGPGRPISQCNPIDLEVHPAGFAPRLRGGADAENLPRYVARAHDRLLAAAVSDVRRGQSRMAVLVGSSSTGKTRACWEAVHPLADEGWLLWHPFDPSRAAAALDELHRVGPQTVVWLNESQHYLGDQRTGEGIAAALHALLTDPERAPVLVLGTLWPEYARRYTARPEQGGPDPHSRVRELLAGRTLAVPDTFDPSALAAAALLAEAGDGLLGGSLSRTAGSGRLAQDLAGAPALLDRYEHATPAARALLEAAMDAQRLGHGPLLSFGLLAEGAEGYLSDDEWDLLADDWLEAGMAYAAAPVTGMRGALVRRRPRARRAFDAAVGSDLPQYRLADYLDQHGRLTRQDEPVPATLWQALLTHGDRNGFIALGEAAQARGLVRLASQFYAEADGGAAKLAVLLDSCGRAEEAHPWWIRSAQQNGASHLLFRVVETAPAGTPEEAESILAWWWEEVPKDGAQGITVSALIRRLGPTGEPRAMHWWHRAAELGHREAEEVVVDHLRATGGTEEVLTWYRDRSPRSPRHRREAAELLIAQQRPEEAISLLSCSDTDDHDAHLRLGRLLIERGRPEEAVEWLVRAGRDLTGFTRGSAVRELLRLERDDVALEVLENAVDTDDEAAVHAARLLEESGRPADAADFWCRAAAAQDPCAWVCLQYARTLVASDRHSEALTWYQRALEGGERRFQQPVEPWEAELLDSQGKTDVDVTQWQLAYAATTDFLGKPLRRWDAPIDEKLTWLVDLTEGGHPTALSYAIPWLCDAGRESEALHWALGLAEQGHDEAPHQIAELYAQAGELDLALQWWERSAQHTSYSYSGYRAGGQALRDAGRDYEAVHWFRRATEAGDIDVLWTAIDAYEALDRREEALEWLWRLGARGGGHCVHLAADVLSRGGREQEAEQLRRYGWEPDGSTAAVWASPSPAWPGPLPAPLAPRPAATGP